MDFGRGRMEASAAQVHFFHLIFILNKTLKLWHECSVSAMIFESEAVKFVWKLENNNHW